MRVGNVLGGFPDDRPTGRLCRFGQVIGTLAVVVIGTLGAVQGEGPPLAEQQAQAAKTKTNDAFWWGPRKGDYYGWSTHSNRLVPIYTFGTRGAGPGIDLDDYLGANSAYRSARRVAGLYRQIPPETVNPEAAYCDQTDLARIQQIALETGKKKHVILVVFDGMDWQTTWAAAIAKANEVPYTSGRGTGLHFQDYQAEGTTQFGFMVTSPLIEGLIGDVDKQTVGPARRTQSGGYSAKWGGASPWDTPASLPYLITKPRDGEPTHAYPDSAPTASAMTTAQKSYNGSINVVPSGDKLMTVAHRAQMAGRSVGVVTSVPVSHATPAAAYAHNVHRDDYQDLSRDLIGRPSISHPEPLPGMDVVLGTGWGVEKTTDNAQGTNFVPGNRYLTDEDKEAIDVENGGKYVVAERTSGKPGLAVLNEATTAAVNGKHRLFGFFGTSYGHLPFQTASGDYQPVEGKTGTETYSNADRSENPTLAEMTTAALDVLSQNEKGFWLLVEAGDVDWANHDNNLDNSVGAVYSGDKAVGIITDWVEQHSSWDETLLIVTADHGHLLVIDDPTVLVGSAK